jgi:hypothetical protein
MARCQGATEANESEAERQPETREVGECMGPKVQGSVWTEIVANYLSGAAMRDSATSRTFLAISS